MMETKDTQIEGLEEILNLIDHGIPYYAYGDNEAACNMAQRLSAIYQIILAHIPVVKALQEENERLNTLVERVKLEATIHAQEARTANATIADIYQAVTKATGEPGNWNGAKPVTDYIATLEAQLAEVREREDILCGLLGEAKAQLAGGEAVAEVYETFGYGSSVPSKHLRWLSAAGQPPAGTKLYTAAPAIKQQVAEDYLLIELGHGNIEIGDGHLEGVPAIVFGRNGNGRVGEQLTFTDREMTPGETIACITFANIAGLDVLQMKMDSLRSHMLAEATTQPVSANQPDGGKVPRNDDVDQLLHAVFQVCEATEEIEPKNEFERGRRFEAKHIRNGIGNWFQDTFCGRKFMGEPVLPKRPSAPIAEGDES